ncbi:hypothetical protein KB20921_07600 [Edwardsiella ictaluri]|nr:hypothetical protein KB20921_07600 [Edwardsiella ictaluri]
MCERSLTRTVRDLVLLSDYFSKRRRKFDSYHDIKIQRLRKYHICKTISPLLNLRKSAKVITSKGSCRIKDTSG